MIALSINSLKNLEKVFPESFSYVRTRVLFSNEIAPAQPIL